LWFCVQATATLAALRDDESEQLTASLERLKAAQAAISELDARCARAEQLHDDVRQCLDIPMEEVTEEGLELSIPAVRRAHDLAQKLIAEAVRSIGEDSDVNVTQAKITAAAESIRALEEVNTDIKQMIQLYDRRIRSPFDEQTRLLEIEAEDSAANAGPSVRTFACCCPQRPKQR